MSNCVHGPDWSSLSLRSRIKPLSSSAPVEHWPEDLFRRRTHFPYLWLFSLSMAIFSIFPLDGRAHIVRGGHRIVILDMELLLQERS